MIICASNIGQLRFKRNNSDRLSMWYTHNMVYILTHDSRSLSCSFFLSGFWFLGQITITMRQTYIYINIKFGSQQYLPPNLKSGPNCNSTFHKVLGIWYLYPCLHRWKEVKIGRHLKLQFITLIRIKKAKRKEICLPVPVKLPELRWGKVAHCKNENISSLYTREGLSQKNFTKKQQSSMSVLWHFLNLNT